MMTRLRIPVGAVLLLTGCGPAGPIAAPAPAPVVVAAGKMTQVSVINALMVGRYDGVVPVAELLRVGDFGVGTLDHLDGELIILDGKGYQVRGDGRVLAVGDDRSTPFAVVTHFRATSAVACPVMPSLAALDAWLDKAIPARNNFVAIRVDGRFGSITVRSVQRQEPPYRPLAEVAASQSVGTHTNVHGTLVGVRCPPWVRGLNVPGYHWHFLADDHQVGGHVLDLRVVDAQVQSNVCPDWEIKLDGSAGFNAADLGQDLNQAINQVEKSRGGPQNQAR